MDFFSAAIPLNESHVLRRMKRLHKRDRIRQGFRCNGKTASLAGSIRTRARKRFRIFGKHGSESSNFSSETDTFPPNGKLEIRLRRLNLLSNCLTNAGPRTKEREEFKFEIIPKRNYYDYTLSIISSNSIYIFSKCC